MLMRIIFGYFFMLVLVLLTKEGKDDIGRKQNQAHKRFKKNKMKKKAHKKLINLFRGRIILYVSKTLKF